MTSSSLRKEVHCDEDSGVTFPIQAECEASRDTPVEELVAVVLFAKALGEDSASVYAVASRKEQPKREREREGALCPFEAGRVNACITFRLSNRLFLSL